MKPNRPVNLDMGTIALPLPAKASVLHRVSGVAPVVAGAGLPRLLRPPPAGAAVDTENERRPPPATRRYPSQPGGAAGTAPAPPAAGVT